MARPGLHKHPKFRRLVKLLNEPVPHVRGYLEMLWEVAYENGRPMIGDKTDVELACEYPGPEGKLFKALLECGPMDDEGKRAAGFIEICDGRQGYYQIHDLLHHAPDYVRKRAKREEERKNKNLGNEMTAERQSLADKSGQRDEVGRTPAPAPAPAPAPKSRNASHSTPEPQAASGEAAGDAEATFPAFPTVGKPGSWLLTEAHSAELSATFPALRIAEEARKAHGWLRANPGRRKTARGMPRFLFGWMERTQNRKGGGSGGQSATTADPAPRVSWEQQRVDQNLATLRAARRAVQEREANERR